MTLFLGISMDSEKNYSTAHALIQLYDKISSALDDKKVTLGVFIDLSKAFDRRFHGPYHAFSISFLTVFP